MLLIPRIGVKAPISYFPDFFTAPFYTPANNCFLVNYARTGIYLALRALKLKKGAKVGMLAYNCDSVMAAIYDSGCGIVFLDVNDNLQLDLDDLQKKKNELSVIVVSHLFGIPSDIDKIKKMCPNTPIIEDCAHAWGSEFSDGTLCGTKGDFSVFSVGVGKFPSLGDGGLLYVNNRDYQVAVSELAAQLSQYKIWENFRLFVKLTIIHIIYSQYVYWIINKLKRNNHREAERCFKKKKMAVGIARLLGSCGSQIMEWRDKRRKNMRLLCGQLYNMESGLSLPDNNLLILSNAFMLPIYCENKDIMITFLKDNGIEAKTHFSMSIKWATTFGYKPGDCPNTEKLLKHLVMLPCYKQYSIKRR